MEQKISIEPIETTLVTVLEQKLQDICLLTYSLLESVTQRDDVSLENGLQRRRQLLQEAELLRVQMVMHVPDSKRRKELLQHLAPVFTALKNADEAFVDALEQKKKEMGEKLSLLYRQQNAKQYTHGGDYGHQ